MGDVKVFYSFSEARRYVHHGAFYISWRGLLFPFWWRLADSKKLVIFTPGRTKREKPVPIFQRASFAADIDANVVCLFDPTLFLNKNLALGWFVGTRHYHYADVYSKLVPLLVNTLAVANKDLLIYGTSGGGIPALWIARGIEGSTVYVSNIQTNIKRYLPRYYDSLKEACFPGLSDTEVVERFGHRFSAFNLDGAYNLVCTQNFSDEHHYRHHFLPFYESNGERKQTNELFCLYDHPESGHFVLPREKEIEIIHHLIAGKFSPELLPKGTALA